jgi:spectinomycin phosphotransferase
MLEKPNIPDELIISRLHEEYDLRVANLTFLPLGADTGTAVYRVVADDGTPYFLKLRRGFQEIIVSVPLFLRSQGIKEIIAPLQTISNQYWADFSPYKMILYPFVEGNDSFDKELTDDLKRELGAALKRIHELKIPPELWSVIPQETFSPQWRDRWKDLQRLVDRSTFDDPPAAKLATFIKSRRQEIRHLIERTEELASELQSKTLDLVLCHTDIHGANVLITDQDELYIVDWDNPLLAPKERDLMFVGGGIDNIWQSKRDESVFYEGYGNTEIDFAVMAYYRYERIIEDLVAYAEQLLLTDEGGADRAPAYERFKFNFEPGSTIEIAENTDNVSAN